MKKDKIAEINQIKAKYSKKIGFFKKIHINFNKKIELYKNNLELREEVNSFLSIVLGIGLFGVIGNLSATLIGVSFNFANIIGIGSFLWLIENKFVGFTVKILSSIKPITINQ